MTFPDMLGNAVSNLGRRKVRTVLTSIGVFIGIVTIVTMVSLGIGVQEQVNQTVSTLGLETIYVSPHTDAAGLATKPLTQAVVDQIKAMPNVASVAAQLDLPDAIPANGLTITLKGQSRKLDASSDQGLVSNSLFTTGTPPRLLVGKTIDQDPDGIVISNQGLEMLDAVAASTADKQAAYQQLLGQPVTINVTDPRGDKKDFTTKIVGIDNDALPATTAARVARVSAKLGSNVKLAVRQWWYKNPDILSTQGYSQLVVKATNAGTAQGVSSQIQRTLNVQVNSLQGLLDTINRIFLILQTMASSIGLLALLVASVGIVNTMIMAIYERTREIGVLKALGASRGDILGMFMLEASFIGLIGGVAGVIGGWLLNEGLNIIIRNYLHNQGFSLDISLFQLSATLVIGSIAFAALIGLLAGLYPAYRAARLNPLAALRHE